MLKPAERHDDSFKPFPAADASHHEEFSELDRLLGAARRQMRVVIAACLLSIVAGVAYIVTAAPQFTASSVVLIDHRRVRAVQDAYDVTAQGMDMAGSAVDSQVELLKSDKIAFAVIDKLQLNRDPEFAQDHPGLISRLLSRLFSRSHLPPVSDEEAGERAKLNALYRLQSNLDVRRVQRTLVLEIRYRSNSPLKAGTIANAYADAYLVDQLDAKYDATRRASSWLLDRMAELKQKVLTSDLAIQKFKADNDLVAAGGKLLNDQQLGEVNSQLVSARAETAKAEARYARIKAIIDSRQTDAVVTEAIGNNAIEQLRTKFLSAAKRESELATRLGPTHGAVAGLRMEMREYERLMFEELNRIAESYLSDLVIAQSREKSLRTSLEGLVGIHASANETAVALRELEREAETYRTLYQTFLQRYQEAVQQQSFPITEARVISSAQTPTAPSHPKKGIILALSLLIGGLIGAGLGALRELRDRAYRTEEQIREELGLEFLGMLPLIPLTKAKTPRTKAISPTDAATEPRLQVLPNAMRYAIEHPLSNFSETLRAVKIAADLTLAGRTPRVIGMVSVLPEEGKSTVAKNFASLLAHLGARTVLIDTDLRNPGLTRSIAPNADAGLVQAVLDGKPIKDLLLYEQETKLAVLPAVIHRRLSHTSEFLASPGMRSVLKQAEQEFEWIVLDLPPLGPVVDVRALASQIDAFVLVVEWGRTTRKLVRTTLEADRQLRDKCLGVVFNKVNMKQLKLYQAYGSKAYYSGEYSSYYRQGA
ncbi:MAG: AAA family ATPase [Hyphomonadaceae bacterium]|jgi:succinoglycan biosynthesis transport protein ExoP|nr:AAA family ATPase [Hyphomonadaceae bacterium]